MSPKCGQRVAFGTGSSPSHQWCVCHVLVCEHVVESGQRSVYGVLGVGGCVSCGGVVRQGTSTWRSGLASQQCEQLTGHAAGEGCVDPWVSAGV